MAQEPISLRAYAQHRKRLGLTGGRLQAVQRAIERERISCVMVNGQKRIADPDAADREWRRNTDYSKVAPSVIDRATRYDASTRALAGFRVQALEDLDLVELHYTDPAPDEDGSDSFAVGIDARVARRLGELLIAAARRMGR